jgi:hypothetical protein
MLGPHYTMDEKLINKDYIMDKKLMKKTTRCFKVFSDIQYSLEYFQIDSLGIKKCVMIRNITPSFY